MANVAYPDYGGECQRCADDGVTWFSPGGYGILLCAEHERIVADEPGWICGEVATNMSSLSGRILMSMDQIQRVIDDAVKGNRTTDEACQSIDTALQGLRNYMADHYRKRLHNCLDLKKSVAAVELEQDRSAGLRRHAREEL